MNPKNMNAMKTRMIGLLMLCVLLASELPLTAKAQQIMNKNELTPEQEAAANNNPTYCYNRGSYFCNRANPRDYRAAVAWLKRAYDLGNQDACYDLGLCYSLTDSPLFDRETAHMWFGRGLANIGDNNYWRCCYQLGFDFKAGRGVEQNYDSAIYFFEQALKYNPVPGNVSTIRNLISQCRQEMNAGSRQSTASSNQQNQQAEEGGSTAFPDGQHFYYQMGNAVDLLHIDFYTDKTDGDRLCHVMQNGVLTFYEMTGVSSNGMEFRGVQFKPEYKMVSYAWSPFPVSQLTGRILNVDTGHRMTVAPGYGRVTLNGRTYDRPLSREAYNRIYDQVFGNGTSVPVTGGAGGSVSAPSGQVQSGMSASYYQETYDRWARVAESAYRSLTATGISVHNRKTDEHAGSAAGTWQGSNYAGMKSELRQAQNAMRDVRNEAQRNGITIRQSTWETATVSY